MTTDKVGSPIITALSHSVLFGGWFHRASITQAQCHAVWMSSVCHAWIVRIMHSLGIQECRAWCAQRALIAQRLETYHWLWLYALLALLTVVDTGVTGAWIAIGTALSLVRLWVAPWQLRFNKLDAWVLAFFGMAFLAASYSSYVVTSWIGLAKFSVFALGYLQCRILFSKDPLRTLPWVIGWLLLLASLQSAIGYYQYINHVEPLATWQDTSVNPELQLTRIFGTLKPSNPNLLAGFLIPCLASSMGWGLSQLVKPGIPRRLGVYGSFASFFVMSALVLTGSRGGYLALLAMMAIMYTGIGHCLWHHPTIIHRTLFKRCWAWAAGLVVMMMTMAVLSSPALSSRVQSIGAMRDDSSNSFRLNVWAATWRLIQDNWWIGIGPGNDTFKKVYGLYMVSGYSALSAYSIFLEMWAEQGLLGLLIFIGLCVTCGLRVLGSLDSQKLTLSHKFLMVGLLAAVWSSVLYGCFDTIWYRPSVNVLFWLMVAALSVVTEVGLQDKHTRITSPYSSASA